MNPDSPFTVHGDETLEARIVAWVLGEASAFEAAELERLCEERPELLVFRRRMLALHGLLTEAEQQQPDDGWKLPAEKRKALDEMFGDKRGRSSDPVIEKRVGRSVRRVLLGIAACLMLTLIVAAFFATGGANIQKAKAVKFAVSREADRTIDFLPASPTTGARSGSQKRAEMPSLPNAKKRTTITAGDTSLASGEALDGINKQGAGEMDLAARDKDGDMDQSVASRRMPAPAVIAPPKRVFAEGAASQPELPAPADAPAEMPALSSLSGANLETTKSDSRLGGAVAESKSASDHHEIIMGKALQAPAAPAAKPASGPMPQTSAGVPASPDMDLAKNMSSGGSGGGELSLGTGVAGGRLKTYTGYAEPSGATADGSGSNPNGVIYYWDARDEQAKGEVYFQTDGYSKGEFLSRNTEAWEAAKSAEFAAKNKASRATKESGGYPDDSQVQPPTLSLALEEKVPTLGDIPVAGQLFKGGKDLAETPAPSAAPLGADAEAPAMPDGGVAAYRQPGERSQLAEREMIRRQNAVTEANQPMGVTEGVRSGDFNVARASIDDALEPKSEPRGAAEEGRLSRDARNRAQLLAEVDKAWDLAVPPDGKQKQVDSDSNIDPVRSNPALTYEHGRNVDALRKNLYQADGNYNLGKYDDAKKSYEEVLRSDPYNSAARRGLERIAQTKSDYYRAAYDHTRAELLSQVDKSWEEATPAEKDGKVREFEGHVQYGAPVEGEKTTKSEALKEMQAATEAQVAEQPQAESKAKEVTTRTKSVEWSVRDEATKASLAKPEPAKPDLTKLFEEVASADEPYSTFSLNISDASFQIAQAAMAKGERPDPAGIKVEQFYNAVDYGDPAPAADEPVAVAIEQSAHPVIPGRNLVRVALKTAAAGRSASQPLHLTLLVDQSGSMSREDRRTAMKQALNGLGGLLSNNDSVTVVGFSRTPHLLADGLSGDQAKNLANLINLEASEGGTNLEEAMKLGEQLAERHKQPGAQNRIVLLTDGAANLGNADPEKLAEKVKLLRQKGLAFDIAGIAAADLNDSLLADLARNGNGRYYVVGKGADENFAKQLAGAFRPAAENVKVQVHFNPERVARYKLIGFEKDRLKTEDFRNDAVDAAEMAAEEAGVAVYQIEPIAGGKGEIGEVSVRFRDAAAGQMVERTWTISHDSSAPAFDRATPSMQLATLAMLAAEKLKGGPFAEAIDFKQLAESRANVKRFYGANSRVAEVLRMIDGL